MLLASRVVGIVKMHHVFVIEKWIQVHYKSIRDRGINPSSALFMNNTNCLVH